MQIFLLFLFFFFFIKINLFVFFFSCRIIEKSVAPRNKVHVTPPTTTPLHFLPLAPPTLSVQNLFNRKGVACPASLCDGIKTRLNLINDKDTHNFHLFYIFHARRSKPLFFHSQTAGQVKITKWRRCWKLPVKTFAGCVCHQLTAASYIPIVKRFWCLHWKEKYLKKYKNVNRSPTSSTWNCFIW